MPTSDVHLPEADRHSIAIITLADEMFRQMRRELSPTFRVRLASNEEQIKSLIDDPDVHGIVFDLDIVEEGAGDAIEVSQEIRRLRDDLILIAIGILGLALVFPGLIVLSAATVPVLCTMLLIRGPSRLRFIARTVSSTINRTFGGLNVSTGNRSGRPF